MSVEGFKNLCSSFEKLSRETEKRLISLPDDNRIILGTGKSNIHMCLNIVQFNQTIEMLQEAIIELSLEQELNEILA